MKWKLSPWLVALGMTFCLPIAAIGQAVTRQETLPVQPAGIGDPLISDFWTFQCPAGGSARVTVDTVALSGAATSPLDPIFYVYFDNFSAAVAIADDEVACTVAPVCGFSCPRRLFNCANQGEYTILVYTSNALDGNCGGTEGIYELEVEVFTGPNGSGSPLPADQVRLGGEEPLRGFQWGLIPPGPAADDVHFWLDSTPLSPGSRATEWQAWDAWSSAPGEPISSKPIPE